MDIVEIARTALSPEDFNDLETASKLYNSMRRGKHLNDWLALLPSLQKGRTLAMKEARTNQPVGRGYNTVFGKFLDQWFPKLNDKKMALSSVLWLGADPQRLAVLKELQNAPGADYSEVTSPITARQHVEKELKDRGVFKPKSRTQGRSPSTVTNPHSAPPKAAPSKHAESSIFKPSGVFISPQVTPPQPATDYSVPRKLGARERTKPQPVRQHTPPTPEFSMTEQFEQALDMLHTRFFADGGLWIRDLDPEELAYLFDTLVWFIRNLQTFHRAVEGQEDQLRPHRQRLCYLIGHRAQRLHDLIAQRATAL